MGGTVTNLTGSKDQRVGGGRAGQPRDRLGLLSEGGRGTGQASTPPQRADTTGTPLTMNRAAASPSNPVIPVMGGMLPGGGRAHAEAKEGNMRGFEINNITEKMKLKMTTPSKKVKTVSNPRRKKTLAGSPLPKRLNHKTRAQYSPLKNLLNQTADNSHNKKNNFELLLKSWEHLSTNNLTPAVFRKA